MAILARAKAKAQKFSDSYEKLPLENHFSAETLFFLESLVALMILGIPYGILFLIETSLKHWPWTLTFTLLAVGVWMFMQFSP